jgi:hypothetical protein
VKDNLKIVMDLWNICVKPTQAHPGSTFRV